MESFTWPSPIIIWDQQFSEFGPNSFNWIHFDKVKYSHETYTTRYIKNRSSDISMVNIYMFFNFPDLESLGEKNLAKYPWVFYLVTV